MKLYAIPYAGGFSFTYLKWKKDLKPGVDLYPIELPGRSGRANDPLRSGIEEMAEFVADKIAESLGDEEYALFGHSMGVYVLVETYRILADRRIRLPSKVILSGMIPPHLYRPKGYHRLPEDEFRERMLDLGGTSRLLLEDAEFADFLFRLLRNDFGAVEQYRTLPEEKMLSCPVFLFNSESDHGRSDMHEWNRYACAPCEYFAFEGGHFFINQHLSAVVETLNRILTSSPVYTNRREG